MGTGSSITLGTIVGSPITTAPLNAGCFDSTIGYKALTQITMTALYVRAVPENSGFPFVTTHGPAIDDVASQNGGTVPSGKTVWAFTIEANALIVWGGAIATGQYA